MILDNALEEAFDSMKISFIADSILNPSVFKLRIWDDTCRGNFLQSVNKTIGDFDGVELVVPGGFALSRRCLSYQALMSYIYQTRFNNSCNVYHEPADFSSQESHTREVIRTSLRDLLETSIREETDQNDNEDDD
jgi:hypothetical protein